jgi:hypothetical protein
MEIRKEKNWTLIKKKRRLLIVLIFWPLKFKVWLRLSRLGRTEYLDFSNFPANFELHYSGWVTVGSISAALIRRALALSSVLEVKP